MREAKEDKVVVVAKDVEDEVIVNSTKKNRVKILTQQEDVEEEIIQGKGMTNPKFNVANVINLAILLSNVETLLTM